MKQEEIKFDIKLIQNLIIKCLFTISEVNKMTIPHFQIGWGGGGRFEY